MPYTRDDHKFYLEDDFWPHLSWQHKVWDYFQEHDEYRCDGYSLYVAWRGKGDATHGCGRNERIILKTRGLYTGIGIGGDLSCNDIQLLLDICMGVPEFIPRRDRQ